jgi:hypothetical protein
MGAMIPDPDNLARTQARPSASVAGYQAGAVANADENLGNEISRMAQQESAQINTTQAQDALNQLAKRKNDLTIAPPNSDGTGGGFKNVTAKNVLAKDANGDTILKTYPAQFQDAVNTIGANLSGPAAQMYTERATAMGNQFQAEVMSHVMEQTDVAHKNSVADTITTNQTAAALDPTNPVAVQAAVQGIKDAVATYGANPRAGDTTQLLKTALSGVHNNVVDQAIAQGNPQYALEYFNQNKKEMTPQDILQSEGKLTYAKRQTAAIGAATDAVQALNWHPGQPLPTEQTFMGMVDDRAKSFDPQTRQAATQEGERQYRMILQSATVAKENAISRAQQEIIKTNGQVPLSAGAHQALQAYAPEYAAQVSNFMAAVDPTKEVQTNQAAYNVAISHPDEMAKMSDSDFLDFQTRNFAAKDRDKIANIRAEYQNGTPKNGPNSLDTSSLNNALNSRLASIDINPRPAPSDLNGQQRVDAVKHFITEDIYGQQAQLGRKMTGPEINARVDELFAKSTDLPGLFYGTNTLPTLSMKKGDIPSADLDAVTKALGANGVAKPTDDQIMNTYWKWKAKNGR